MTKIEELSKAVQQGKAKIVPELVREALDAGYDPDEILNVGMIGAMDVVGDLFKNKEIFVPEMLIAANAMKKGLAAVKPYLQGEAAAGAGKIIMGTVQGDLHDIGKNLVIMMWESAGFEVVDLGIDVPPEKFIEAYRENPDTRIIGCSALLTTTLPFLEKTVKALNESDFRSKIKIMVGGAPVNQAFADKIGADAYAPDAAAAAKVAKQIL